MACFPVGSSGLTEASGSRAEAGFWASWAPRFQATSRSSVGGAQVPHYTLPLEGLAAAFNQTGNSGDPFCTESLPLRWSTQMWIIMRREQFWGEGFWPILSEEDQRRLLWKPLLGGFGGHSLETTQVKTGSDSIYHTLFSLRNRSLCCIFINLPSYRSASFVSLGEPFVLSAGAWSQTAQAYLLAQPLKPHVTWYRWVNLLLHRSSLC